MEKSNGVPAQIIFEKIQQQRNDALNLLAQEQAVCAVLSARIKELEAKVKEPKKQGGKS